MAEVATIVVKDANDVSREVPTLLSLEQLVATETTLAGILAKLIASPATEAKQDAAALLLQGIIDAIGDIPGGGGGGGDASAANQVTGNALLTSIAGYVDGLEGKDFATQTTLAAVLAKLIAAPATEAKQDTLIAKDFATQTTLAAVLAKIIATPATEAKQDALNTLITTQNGYLDQLEGYVDGLEALIGSTNTKLDTVHTDLVNFAAGEYETVAASATTQALGATGATGDYLAGVLIIPATTSPGAVAIKDGAGGAITVFAGGASSVSNLVPFFVPLGIKSAAGAWQVTTGSNVSAIGVGNFT